MVPQEWLPMDYQGWYVTIIPLIRAICPPPQRKIDIWAPVNVFIFCLVKRSLSPPDRTRDISSHRLEETLLPLFIWILTFKGTISPAQEWMISWTQNSLDTNANSYMQIQTRRFPWGIQRLVSTHSNCNFFLGGYLPLTANTYITAYYKHTQINFIQVIGKGRSCVSLKEPWAKSDDSIHLCLLSKVNSTNVIEGLARQMEM